MLLMLLMLNDVEGMAAQGRALRERQGERGERNKGKRKMSFFFFATYDDDDDDETAFDGGDGS